MSIAITIQIWILNSLCQIFVDRDLGCIVLHPGNIPQFAKSKVEIFEDFLSATAIDTIERAVVGHAANRGQGYTCLSVQLGSGQTPIFHDLF